MAGTFKTTRQFRHEFYFHWKHGAQELSAACFAVFNIRPINELEEATKNAFDDDSITTTNAAILSVVLHDFGGIDIEDTNGEPLPKHLYLDAAIRDPVLSAVLVREWSQGHAGIGEGNSSPET